MKFPTVPTIESDNTSTFILFITITGMFLVLMVAVGKSFDFVKKPIENSPEIIKKFHTQYLLAFLEILIIYIYFIFICFILKDTKVLGSLLKWMFVLVNLVLSVIVIGIASDTLTKIKKESGDYKAYTDLLNKLVGGSVVLLVISLLWIIIRIRSNRVNTLLKPQQTKAQQNK